MTLRQLAWMAGARKALEGEVVAWLIANLPQAVWAPDKLPKGDALNPFRERPPVSEAMQLHLASKQARRWRVLSGG